MRKWRWVMLGIAIALALALLALYLRILAQPFPRSVLRQASFGIWYPPSSDLGYAVDRQTIKYSNSSGDRLVSFVANNHTNTLTFTEQAQPESFTDVPDVYTKLIQKLQGYATIESVNGQVDLTRPTELHGAQTAVLKAKGTLIFIKPNQNLSVDQWRQLINNLDFVH